MQLLLEEAVESVGVRDMTLCAGFMLRTILLRTERKMLFRKVVIDEMKKDGMRIIRRMLKRHAGYKKLPCALRGKVLNQKAKELCLVQRTNKVRVDTKTLREECELAEGRYKMRMGTEVGQACKKVIMLKTKRRNCVQGIIKDAVEKGVNTS